MHCLGLYLRFFLVLFLQITLVSCGYFYKRPLVSEYPVGYTEKGLASWYGLEEHGKPTASGEPFNMFDYTAAHKSLPFGTHVEVRNLKNGKVVVVRINDRGPFIEGRIIDLSYASAQAIGMLEDGIVPVELKVVDLPTPIAEYRLRGYYVQIGSF
ncbi:MAG: septal ring lytic transglycosylase RlpA family protein, partial [candidate division WOR-3 bacterium]